MRERVCVCVGGVQQLEEKQYKFVLEQKQKTQSRDTWEDSQGHKCCFEICDSIS